MVATPAHTTHTWRFGMFEVDAQREELRRSGVPIKLREQSFRVLVSLLEHSGELITREDLRRALWPSDTFVDFDHGLNTAVMKLREALGDTADKPLYIETIPKRGYRFVAPVRQVESGQNGIADASGISALRDSARPDMDLALEAPVHSRSFRLVIGFVGFAILATAGFLIFIRSGKLRMTPRTDSESVSNVRFQPVTTAPGDAQNPVFSPNGAWIAFTWDGPQRNHFDIYLQLVGSDTQLRLTNNKGGFLGRPAWSPDGTEIAFRHCDGKNDGIYSVPTLGGEVRKLTDANCRGMYPGPLAWISGGKAMLMFDRCSADQPFGVVLFSLKTGEKRCLTNFGAMRNASCNLWFSLSPDSKTIAFTVPTAPDPCLGDIYTVPVAGGMPRPATVDGFVNFTFMWTPDGKSIVFRSNRATLPSLWRVSANGGPIERESLYPAVGSFSSDGRHLVYSETTWRDPPAIWEADLANAGGPVLRNEKLVGTQYIETSAQPSPDGKRLVWMSYRTGFEEIWISDATGRNPLQLTHLNTYSGSPRWSPDGHWIAFDSYSREGSQILIIDTEGRNLHSITQGPNKNVVPSWSRDGKSVYFTSNRTGSWQVWKHALMDGAEVQITRSGGFDPFESFDGRTIYFSKFDQGGIWSTTAGDGVESLVVPDKPQVLHWGLWAVTRSGLYFLNAYAEPRPQIEFYNFATRRISAVLALEKRPLELYPSLSATADGRSIYYTQRSFESVIKMMEVLR